MTPEQEKELRRKWQRIGAEAATTWDSFQDFSDWFLEYGYGAHARILKSRNKEPHGPHNSYLKKQTERNRRNGQKFCPEHPVADLCAECRIACSDEEYFGCEAWRKNFAEYWNQYIHREVQPEEKTEKAVWRYPHPGEIIKNRGVK